MTIAEMENIFTMEIPLEGLVADAGIYEFHIEGEKSIGVSYEHNEDGKLIYIFNIFLGSEYVNISGEFESIYDAAETVANEWNSLNSEFAKENHMTKILIVEDSDMKYQAIKESLSFLQSHKITRVTTRNEALQFLYKEEVDIIILDMQFPTCRGGEILKDCGLQVLKRIRHRGIDTPVIICSSCSCTVPENIKNVLGYILYDGNGDLSNTLKHYIPSTLKKQAGEPQYKIEVLNNGEIHIEHSVSSKDHLLQTLESLFALYEGWNYRITNLADKDVIVEGAMDICDLDVLKNCL